MEINLEKRKKQQQKKVPSSSLLAKGLAWCQTRVCVLAPTRSQHWIPRSETAPHTAQWGEPRKSSHVHSPHPRLHCQFDTLASVYTSFCLLTNTLYFRVMDFFDPFLFFIMCVTVSLTPSNSCDWLACGRRDCSGHLLCPLSSGCSGHFPRRHHGLYSWEK